MKGRVGDRRTRLFEDGRPGRAGRCATLHNIVSTDAATTAEIVRWMLEVEKAYFNRAGDVSSGEFDFEPLKGENPGEPIYVTRLSAEALDRYGADLERLERRLPAMADRCRRPEELLKVRRCLANVMRDVRRVQAKA